jgi:hypothetical protein
MQNIESPAKSAKDIVTEWQQAVERRDYTSVRGLLKDLVDLGNATRKDENTFEHTKASLVKSSNGFRQLF